MARRNGVWVPLVAFVLGMLAVSFSFLAYARRIKSDEVGPKVNGSCIYPSSSSCALGIMAAVFLLTEQITISSGTNCFCCCGARFSSACTAVTSIILFIMSWLTFVIAFLGLIYTAILNNNSYLAKAYPGNNGDICKVGKETLFLGAAFWCIITLILGLLSYALLVYGADCANNNDQREVNSPDYGQGVIMGQPQTQLSKD